MASTLKAAAKRVTAINRLTGSPRTSAAQQQRASRLSPSPAPPDASAGSPRPMSPGARGRRGTHAPSPSSPSGLSADEAAIKVCVRVRCWIAEEKTGERSGPNVLDNCIQMPRKTTVTIQKPGEASRDFEFDRCFWSFDENHPFYATQATLQEEIGTIMIDNALTGFNNCIFAYGQTGSGKSYSVLGGKGDDRGLLPRVVEGLFESFKDLEDGTTVKTVVAFIEIYNERLRDLLAPQDQADQGPSLDVKQHPVLGVIVPGLTESPVENCKEVLDLVEYGASIRRTSSTAMNATSSRSHCIFSFKTNVQKGDTVKLSQTHLVDLAGSERQKRTQAEGARLKEGAAINKSLSTLARVISTLADTKRNTNPPFRDSKLTYMLKESLSGNSKTFMMAAISPSLADYDETLSTLNFAKSVKKVQTNAKSNVLSSATLEQALREEVEALKLKIQRAMEEQARDGQDAKLKTIQERMEKQKECMTLLGLGSEDPRTYASLRTAESAKMERRRSTVHDRMSIMLLEEEDEGSGTAEEWDGQDTDTDSSTRSKQIQSRGSSPRASRLSRADSRLSALMEESRVLARYCGTADRDRDDDTGCFLKLEGPLSSELEGVDAEAMSRWLQQLQDLAAEAEALACQLAGELGKVSFRGMVTVEVGEEIRVDVVARAIVLAADGHHQERWFSQRDFEDLTRCLRAADPGSAAATELLARIGGAGWVEGREVRELRDRLEDVRRELHRTRCRTQIARAELRANATLLGGQANGIRPNSSRIAQEAHKCSIEATRKFNDALAAVEHARDLVTGLPSPGVQHSRRRLTLEALWEPG